jgi:hypothetical protein
MIVFQLVYIKISNIWDIRREGYIIQSLTSFSEEGIGMFYFASQNHNLLLEILHGSRIFVWVAW